MPSERQFSQISGESRMSRQVTCAMCGRPVDNSETVEMPNGSICDDPCYKWLEQMMDEINDDPDIQVDFIEVEDDEDEDDEEDW